MGQYQTGTVTVTNNGATVVGSGTEWTTYVAPGDLFGVAASTIVYIIGNVVNDTTLVLTQPYLGVTESGAPYGITRDFTPINGIPYPNQGDIQTASIVQRALLKIDSLIDLSSAFFTPRGDWLQGTSYAVNDLVIYEASQDFSGNIYRCVVAHTASSSFTADLGAGKWVLYIDNTTINLAQKWAANPEDVIVDDGKYSALHYAIKASDSAALAEAARVAAEASEAAAAQSEANVAAAELEFYSVADRFINEINAIEQKVNYVEYTAIATRNAVALTSGDFVSSELDLGDDNVSGTEWLDLEQIPEDQFDLSIGSSTLDLNNTI